MSLLKCLKCMYVVNLMLALTTTLSLVPIAQQDGKNVSIPLILALIKMTTLILTLILL